MFFKNPLWFLIQLVSFIVISLLPLLKYSIRNYFFNHLKSNGQEGVTLATETKLTVIIFSTCLIELSLNLFFVLLNHKKLDNGT